MNVEESHTESLLKRNSLYSEISKKSNLPHYIGLFLISPVLAAASGITNFKQRSAKITLMLFMGVVGYTIILRVGNDSYDVMLDFLNHYRNLSTIGFFEELLSIIKLQGSETTVDEPYMSILSFTVARFTDNPRWLFTVIGLVYGFFYIKGISLVYSEIKEGWKLSITVLFIFFLFLVSMEGINAPRTHTAGWVFFSGAYLYYKTENRKYLLYVLFAPIVHIGYLAIVLPFFVYNVLGHRKYLYIAILLISYFASANMSVINPVLEQTELGQTKQQQYTGENWDERIERQNKREYSFHREYYVTVSRMSIRFMFIFSILLAGYIKNDNHDRLQNALGGISILLLSFSNVIYPAIHVLGNRLFVSFSIFGVAYLIRLYSRNFRKLNSQLWIVYLCIPGILLFLYTKWSIIGDFLDFKVLFSPLLYPFLGDDPFSMKEFIKQILDL